MKNKYPHENNDFSKARKLKLVQLRVAQLADENLFKRLEQAEAEAVSGETASVRIDYCDLLRLKKLAKPAIEKYLQDLAELEFNIDSDAGDETITGVETVDSVFGSEEWDPPELPEDEDEFYH